MLPTDLVPKAQQIIDRLAAINYENPKICEHRIREAFSQHLKALNLPNRPVEIYRSFYAAFDAARKVVFDAEWDAAFEAAQEAVSDAACEAAREAADDAIHHFMSDAAMEAAMEAACDNASWEAAREAASDAALRAVKKTASDPLWNTAWNEGFNVVFDHEWDAAWSNYAADCAFKYALEALTDTSLSAYEAARDRAREAAIEAALDGNRNVVREALWDTETVVEIAVICVNHTTSSPQHDQLCAVWMPFVDAVEAGLFCFWVTTTKVIALTLPVMRIENDGLHQLHADGQPAVQWSDRECYYFWRGLQIPQKYGAVLSLEWRSQWLLEEPNAELRRVLIQGIGYDRVVQELGANIAKLAPAAN